MRKRNTKETIKDEEKEKIQKTVQKQDKNKEKGNGENTKPKRENRWPTG